MPSSTHKHIASHEGESRRFVRSHERRVVGRWYALDVVHPRPHVQSTSHNRHRFISLPISARPSNHGTPRHASKTPMRTHPRAFSDHFRRPFTCARASFTCDRAPFICARRPFTRARTPFTRARASCGPSHASFMPRCAAFTCDRTTSMAVRQSMPCHHLADPPCAK